MLRRSPCLTALLLLAAAVTTGAQAASLPIRPGAYVREGVPCRDAPLAALLQFDGKAFSGPHDGDCDTQLMRKTGRRYQLKTVCRAAGDGSSTASNTQAQTVTVRSPSRFTFSHPTGAGRIDRAAYRLCPAGSQR